MNTHCNVQCSRVQFAKWLLEGSSISTPLDPGYEGGRIAAEVLDSCDSLRELCAKCGRNLTCGGLPLITCTGICQPRRTFHSKCVPKSRRTDHDFKCLGLQIGRTSASVATALLHKISFFAAQTPLWMSKFCPPIVLSQRTYSVQMRPMLISFV